MLNVTRKDDPRNPETYFKHAGEGRGDVIQGRR